MPLAGVSSISARRLLGLQVTAVAIIFLGLFFRVYHLDKKAYWDDEAVASIHILGVTEREVVQAADGFRHISDLRAVLHPGLNSRTLLDTIDTLRAEDPQHPPLYYVIARGWVALFGDSRLALRTLSVLFGVLAIPCMWWLCWELFGTRAAGWVGSALVAVSPIDILYSQEVREYSLWLVAILVTNALFIRALRTASRISWGAYAVSLGLSLYVFPVSALVASAHAIVAICTRAEHRRRAYAVGAIIGGFMLFAPWMFVAIDNIAQINKGMATIINSPTSPLHVFAASASLVRLSVLDMNGEYRRAALLAGIPIVALIAYAMYQWRQCSFPASRVYLWAMALCTTMPFILMDLLLGGHRTEVARYFIPMYVTIDIALAAVILMKLPFDGSSRAKPIWGAVLTMVLIARIGSCALIAHASTWWSKYNIRSLPVAAEITAAGSPLLLSDDYIVWALMLSEYLDPHIDVVLHPRCYLCTLPSTDLMDLSAIGSQAKSRDIFVVGPSDALLHAMQTQLHASPEVGSIRCIKVRSQCSGDLNFW